jgi:hypothetical protein
MPSQREAWRAFRFADRAGMVGLFPARWPRRAAIGERGRCSSISSRAVAWGGYHSSGSLEQCKAKKYYEVNPGDDASTDRPVKSETNSLEQSSNHGFTRHRSTKAGDAMSRAKNIHLRLPPLPSKHLNICDASGKPLIIPARQRGQQPRQQHLMDIPAMAR